MQVSGPHKFWPGDVVDVVGFGSEDGNKTGGMKVRSNDTIAVGKFYFKGKTLNFDFSRWQVLLTPNTEAMQLD